MIDWILSSFRGSGSISQRKEAWVSTLTLPTPRSSSVPAFREAVGDLAAELDRARRYQHPFALLVMSLHQPDGGDRSADSAPSESGGAGEIPPLESRVPHLVAYVAASAPGKVLRKSDIATYDAVAQWFVIVLPESDLSAARLAVGRLDRLIRRRMGIRIRVGLSVFPEDGLTLRQLLEKAEAAWSDSPEPVRRSEATDDRDGPSEEETVREPVTGIRDREAAR